MIMIYDTGNIFFRSFNMLARGPIISDLKYGEDPAMTYDEYPVNDPNAPLVIFWHGGSWKTGSKNMYKFVGHKLQHIGAHAFVINYPKFPKRTFPGFIDDAKKAVETIRDIYPNRKVFVMGHSAGGNTALLVAIDKYNKIDGAIALSAPDTLAARYWRPVFGDAIDDKSYDPRTLTNLSDVNTKFLIIHGALDYIVSVRDSISLHKQLDKAGLENKLIILRIVEHLFILPTIMVGPRLLTRNKIKRFIFNT
jgi:acetyl esterase/lipase